MANKFVNGNAPELVERDDIIQNGDWILKWNADTASDTSSGYEFLTPTGFDPNSGQGPVGGIMLAAFYFLVEHDAEFYKDIVARANKVANDKVIEFDENEDDYKGFMN